MDVHGNTQVVLENDLAKICEAIPPESVHGWVLNVTDLDAKSLSARPVVSGDSFCQYVYSFS